MTGSKQGRTKTRTPRSPTIGTENESSLHRALKFQYAAPGTTETARAGYICDALGPKGEAIEIQTGSFGVLKTKIPALAKAGKVRLIYPVIVNKTIELYDTKGTLLSCRKSPRKGTIWDIFRELIYAPVLVKLPRLTIEIVLVDAIERRLDDGKGSWRRKGISIEDRILTACRERIVLKKNVDWQKFLPLIGEFTSKTLAAAAHIRPDLARKTLYVLEKAGFVKKLKKQGRSWLYRRL
ncbi:hypothetical protein AGMMS50230_13240 [Spirochaetia bacterium]|nr:hypothetical protein AGMMS50230_13240 [Spirochaetia bacterium]